MTFTNAPLLPGGRAGARWSVARPLEGVTSADADVLVVLDSLAPSSLLSLARPLTFLPVERVAVLSHQPADAVLPPGLRSEAVTTTQWQRALPYVRAVAEAGDYLAPSGQAFAWPRRPGPPAPHRPVSYTHPTLPTSDLG